METLESGVMRTKFIIILLELLVIHQVLHSSRHRMNMTND